MRYLFFILLFLITGLVAEAAIRTTSSDGDMHTAGNWGCTCIPGAADTIVINHDMTTAAALARYMQITVNATGSITQSAGSGRILRSDGNTIINSGGSVDIQGSADLFITMRDFTLASGATVTSLGTDIIVGTFLMNGDYNGNSLLYLIGTNEELDGSGTFNNTGEILISGDRIIPATADLTKTTGLFRVGSNFDLINRGTISIDSLTLNNINSTWTNDRNSNLTIRGAVDLSAGLYFYADSTDNTVTYAQAGTDTQLVADPWGGAYYNLVIGGTSTGGAKVLQDDIEILGDLEINSNGRLSLDTYEMDVAGDLTMDGAWNLGTQTITFDGNEKQTITSSGGATITFYNLINANKFDTLEMDKRLAITNDLQLDAGSKLDCNDNSLQISGDFIQNGEFIPRESYVQFMGSNALSIRSVNLPSINFYNVLFQVTDTIELEIDANIENDVYVWFNDTLVTDENLNVAGDIYIYGRFDATANSTLIMDGTGPQTITASSDSLNKFINSNASDTVTLATDVVFKSTAAFGGNSTFDVSTDNRTITCLENFGNFGTFVHREGEVIMAASSSQNLIGDYTFYDLTINNTSGATPAVRIISGKDSIRNALTLTEGQFETDDSLIFISDANGTAYIKEITGGSITGEIVYQNYINAGATNWRFMTSPVVGADLEDWDEDFLTTGFTGTDYPNWQPGDLWPSMYYYNEAPGGPFSNGWTSPASTAVVIDTGQGYSVWCGDTITGTEPFTIDVRGEADTGDINMPVTYNFLDISGFAGWNLVGNPYPAPINWDDADWTKTNIEDAIYIWDPDAEQYASYVAGVGSNGGSEYIAPSQGFWVKASGSSPVLTAREGIKYDSTTVGFKSNSKPKVMRLKLTGNGHSDETVFRFEDDATNGFDGQYDAFKMYSYNWQAPSLASLVDTIDYSINSLPLEEDISIPLLVYVGATKQYTFSVEGIEELGINSCIVLEDRETGTFVNLRNTPSYTVTIPYTIESPRFYLHVSSPLETQGISVSCNGMDDGMAIAQGLGSGPWDYTWYDAKNNIIDSSVERNTADTLSPLAAGVYRVSIGNGSGYCPESEAMITITEPEVLAVELEGIPESCKGESDGSVLTVVNGGTPPYIYLWNTGETTSILNDLGEGDYSLKITDNNGCDAAAKITLNAPVDVVSDFQASMQEIEEGQTIAFTNNSVGAEYYSWDFGDGYFSNEENPTHSYRYAGDYIVLLSAERGPCYAVSRQKVIVNASITGIEETITSPVRVALYPNPATESDRVFLRMEDIGMEEVLVVVSDLLGRQWYSKVIVTNGNGTVIEAIDVDGRLPSGTYMVTGSSQNELFSKKLVIR